MCAGLPQISGDFGSSSESENERPASEDDCCCKYTRVARSYGITAKVQRFGEEWQDPDGMSLRTIAREYNKTVLQRVLREVDEPPLSGEVDNLYGLLNGDDDISKGAQKRAEDRLRKFEVNVDQLKADFISYRTVDRHFKECEGREKRERDDEDSTTVAINRIRRMQSRLEAVAEKTVLESAAEETVSEGDFDVSVGVTVTCRDCNQQYLVSEYLEEGCSECQTDERTNQLA